MFRRKSLFALGLATLCACAPWLSAHAQSKKKPKSYKPVTITAKPTYQPPMIDGKANDAVWQAGPAVTLKAYDGTNFKDGKGATTINLRAVYTHDTLYVLAEYDDPTQSLAFEPYVREDDGKWSRRMAPDAQGSGDNQYHEDKLALLWNVDDSIQHFNTRHGCQAACHGGDGPKAPPARKMTRDESELGDIWLVKAVRTLPVGQADDLYLDNTLHGDKTPRAGLKFDLKSNGGYETVRLIDGKPEFMPRSAKPANAGGAYWLVAAERAALENNRFKQGDELPSVQVSPFAGDRGDIVAAAQWENGRWTVEIARKLVTGSHYDLNFRDLTKAYGFGLAVFDNAQQRHAMVREPLKLVFKP